MQILLFLTAAIGAVAAKITNDEYNCYYAVRVCPNYYYDPVCAYDDKKKVYETFDNLCNLHDYNCEQKTHFVVQHAGPCNREKYTKPAFPPQASQSVDTLQQQESSQPSQPLQPVEPLQPLQALQPLQPLQPLKRLKTSKMSQYSASGPSENDSPPSLVEMYPHLYPGYLV